MAIRFGSTSPLVEKLSNLVDALTAVVSLCLNFPLSEEQKAQASSLVKEVRNTEAQFLGAAKEELDDYASPTSGGPASIR